MKKCCSILSVLCLLAALMSGCASSGQSPAAETPAATQAPAAVPVQTTLEDLYLFHFADELGSDLSRPAGGKQK